MSHSTTPDSPTDGVIREAVELYGDHWKHFALIALLVYLIIAALSAVLVMLLGPAGSFIAAVITVIGVFWLQGALVRAVEDVRDGRVDLSIRETFDRVKPHIGPIAAVSILAGLGITLGFVFFVIPGLYLMTIWSLVIPIVVLEDRAIMETFGRSRSLVSGRGWQVFGVILLAFLVLMAVSFVIGLVTVPLGNEFGRFVADLLSGVITGPFVAAVWTLLYYRLRGDTPAGPWRHHEDELGSGGGTDPDEAA